MQREIWNILEDERFLDNGEVIEDVQSAEMPTIEHPTTELGGAGMAGKIDMPDMSQVNALSITLNHNNGRNGHLLRRAGVHHLEFRAAMQVMDVEKSIVGQKMDKFRIDGLHKSSSVGTTEKGNPRSSTETYSVVRYEHERGGQIIDLIDIPKGIMIIGGVDVSSARKSLLD